MIGKIVSHYKILEKLGEGGMGVVYKAEDTKLKRTVALKFLPPELTRDPEAKKRFVREAQAASALDHSYIGTIYEINETEDGQLFIAMACYEGETLKQKIEKGPLKIKDAVEFAMQVAEGLANAHEQGIIHRDIKPDNVMVTGANRVKILDFGLAKLQGQSQFTKEGTTLGTVAYMSPEQLRGEDVDHRTDIWSLGVLIYEMVTGRVPFKGDYEQAVTYSILNEEPEPMTGLRTGVPMDLERIVAKAMAKEPAERYQNVVELPVDLRGVKAPPKGQLSVTKTSEVQPRQWKQTLSWSLTVLTTLVALSLFLWPRIQSSPPTEQPTTRFAIQVPRINGWRAGPGAAISPDGRSLAYVSPDDAGRDVIWIRPLDAMDGGPLEGTEGAYFPFWSPDGRSLGFFADQSLKRIAVSGGAPQTLADAPNAFGGSWNSDGVIVFSPNMRSPLHQVPEQGGNSTPATAFDPGRQDGAHTSPSFLPDGRQFIFSVAAADEHAGIYVGSLESPETRLLLGATSPGLVTRDGFLLFIEERLVRAQRLDTDTWALTGERLTVGESALQEGGIYRDAMSLSVSANGTLAYRQGKAARKRLTWFDRAGTRLGTVGREGNYVAAVLSPDESRVAVGRDGDIWIIELSSGARYPLTSGPANDFYPVWSPDARYVAYGSGPPGGQMLYRTLSSGTGETELLHAGGVNVPFNWSAGHIALFRMSPETLEDIYVLPVDGDREPIPYLQTQASEHECHLSPDGQWMAYVSESSGRPEVYVETFPASDLRVPISSSGGVQPIWRSDGQELFFMTLDGRLMAVPVRTEPSFKAGAPEPLFQTNGRVWAARNS